MSEMLIEGDVVTLRVPNTEWRGVVGKVMEARRDDVAYARVYYINTVDNPAHVDIPLSCLQIVDGN